MKILLIFYEKEMLIFNLVSFIFLGWHNAVNAEHSANTRFYKLVKELHEYAQFVDWQVI